MRSRLLIVTMLFLSVGPSVRQSVAQTPKFEDVLSLQSVGGAVISPDGKHIAYTVRTTEWKENRYDNHRSGEQPRDSHGTALLFGLTFLHF